MCALFLLVGFVLASSAAVQPSVLPFTVESVRFGHPSGRIGVFRVDYANTSAKEEYGDAPWVTRNGSLPLIFVVKDAGENVMCFDYLRLYRDVGAARTLIAADETDKTITADQVFWTVDLTTDLFGAAVGDTLLFEWELQFSDNFCLSSHLNHYFNRVLVGAPLPTLADWKRVDTHYHTEYTDNIFEFGGHLVTVAKAAQAVGLDAVCATDHSTDLGSADWDSLTARSNRFSTDNFLFIPGEELTVDSDETNQFPDDRIHLLAIGLDRRLAAPEECCAENSSSQLWTLRQALDSVTVQNGVAMAAHPSANFTVGFGGSLAVWSPQNWAIGLTYPVFVASEFFNERKTVMNNTSVTEDYIYPYGWQPNADWEAAWRGGMNQYLSLVQTHLNPLCPLALAGGSDAHGDLAYKTTNQYGTIQLTANDAGIGKVHALVYAPGGLTQAGLLDGMRQGAMVMSDGPAFTMTVDRDGNGSSDGTVGGMFALTPSAQLNLTGASIAEFGTFTVCRIIRVTPGAVETTFVPVSGWAVNAQVSAYTLAAPGQWTAVLADLRTANGYRAVTSPVYFAPQGSTGVGLTPFSFFLASPRPNPVTADCVINFSLPEDGPVDLSIYDVQGRLVDRLIDGWLPAGNRTVLWRPSLIPSSLYLVRLTTPSGRLSKPIVFLR